MRRTVQLALVLTLALPTLVALPLGSASAADDNPGLPRCITMTSEARTTAGGYDHVVRFASQCGAPAFCTVSTDAQPNPLSVELPERQSVDVVTLAGSTERAFRPQAFCLVDDP
jgi:hypothetical protein